MLINKINNAPVTTPESNSNFKGKLILRGRWTENMKLEIMRNYKKEGLESITKDLDIVARMRSKKLLFGDKNHMPGARVYKLYLSTQKQNSLKDKLLNFFNLKSSMALTSNWHREYSMGCNIADRFEAEKVKYLLDL